MKIKEFAHRMNDHGTKPRVKIWKCKTEWGTLLIYEGRPDEIPADIGNMKINSFVVSGVGFVEIYTTK